MNASVRDQLLREIATLPAREAGTVLDFVRWLKAQSTPDSELDARFEAAVRKAGDEARARGISDEDIAAEIAAHRAGR